MGTLVCYIRYTLQQGACFLPFRVRVLHRLASEGPGETVQDGPHSEHGDQTRRRQDAQPQDVLGRRPARWYVLNSDPKRSIVVKWIKIFKTEKKTIEIQSVRPTEVCGKVLSNYFTHSSNETLGTYFNHFFSLKKNTHMTTMLHVGSL